MDKVEQTLDYNDQSGSIELAELRLDLAAQRLILDGRAIDLRPKSWELLKYMAQRPGQLLTKSDLVEAVWADRVVTEASLNQAVRDLRLALGDDARAPRFIETVHRRGFRFIAGAEEKENPPAPATISSNAQNLVGREQELIELQGLFNLAVTGQRQLCFVTGEPGIGKTSLVQAFLNELPAPDDAADILIGQGQCIDQHGEGEAYLPILEALDRLARGPKGELIRQQLQRYAPTWLIQIPWLLPSCGLDYDPQLVAATPARMLREFCVLIESLTAEASMILWLEDLHWSDHATIDLLGSLARRQESSRLLILASYRPVDAAILNAPVCHLKQSLSQQQHATELPVELLSKQAVDEYLEEQFKGLSLLTELADMVYATTDGNPLFVVTLANYLVARQLLVNDESGWRATVPLGSIQRESPDSLKSIIGSQLQQISDSELSLLETASVIGTEFSAQAIANTLALDLDQVEKSCDELAKRDQFLTSAEPVEWPNNTVGQGYKFIHDVHRRAMYEGLSPSRRQRLHVRAGDTLEAGYTDQLDLVAAELALHFEIGRDPERAIVYLRAAAEQAQRRSAVSEAASYLRRALTQVATLPQRDENEQCELDLRLRLMRVLITVAGYTATEHAENLQRALELCANLQDQSSELQILALQCTATILGGDIAATESNLARAKDVGKKIDNAILLSHEPTASGLTALAKGELKSAEVNFKRSIELLSTADLREPTKVFGHDPTVVSLGYSSISAWLLGHPDEARRRGRMAISRSESIGTPLVLANALDLALTAEHLCGDIENAQRLADALDACMEKYGVEYAYSRPLAARNWLLLMTGNIDAAISGMQDKIREVQTTRHGLFFPIMYNTLAEALLRSGDLADGLEVIDGSLERMQHGEKVLEAESWRLKGELLHAQGINEAAEKCLRRALEVSARQCALSLELRAANSLTRLHLETGLATDAGQKLEQVIGQFKEGFDTADVREAHRLMC